MATLLLSLLDITQDEVELGKQDIYSITGEQSSITWVTDILRTDVNHRMDKVIEITLAHGTGTLRTLRHHFIEWRHFLLHLRVRYQLLITLTDRPNLNMLMTLTRSRITTTIVEDQTRNILQNGRQSREVTQREGFVLTLKLVGHKNALHFTYANGAYMVLQHWKLVQHQSMVLHLLYD